METLGPFKGICRVILGLYWDNGKENGNYYSILGVILGIPRGPCSLGLCM